MKAILASLAIAALTGCATTKSETAAAPAGDLYLFCTSFQSQPAKIDSYSFRDGRLNAVTDSGKASIEYTSGAQCAVFTLPKKD